MMKQKCVIGGYILGVFIFRVWKMEHSLKRPTPEDTDEDLLRMQVC